MFTTLKRIHASILSWFVLHYRTKAIVRQFEASHREELKITPLQNWPILQARQSRELDAVRAGKLDTPIMDRKSWQWPFLPASVNRLAAPIAKASPYNLRRISRTPVPRRAINLIKGAIIAQPWDIIPLDDVDPIDDEDAQRERIKIAKKVFNHLNNTDSFQTFVEQGLEDMLILGAFCAELAFTMDPKRPIKSWPVNVESIRIFASYQESTPDMPHYAQMTGLKGERGAVLFYDDELLYIKDNPSTDNPFGLGKMEVGFSAIVAFLGVQDMSGKAGADQVHKCFPGGTEVLTRRGWVEWRDARDDDEFATRSIDGQFQWQRPLAFVREWHDGDMIRFHNRNLSITVTPNHRMYGHCVYKIDRQYIAAPLGFVEARHLFDAATHRTGKRQSGSRSLADFRVPTTSIWEGGTLPTAEFQLGYKSFAWEDWAAFLGIWVAEGSFLGSGRGIRVGDIAASASAAIVVPIKPPRSDYRVQVAQSKQANRDKYEKITGLLERMGLSYQQKSDRFICTDRDLWTYVSVLGNDFTRHVPQWIKDAPADIIRIFVDWAMLGDGTCRKGKRIYYTVSKQLADDMQELFQKIGTSAAVIWCKRDRMYAVEEMLKREVSIIPSMADGGDRMPERIPYSDMVYCATVPNGTLYCRENGYPFFSGNTWLWWESPQSDSAYQIVRRHIQNELEGQAKVSIIGGMKKPEVIEIQPVLEQDLLLNWQELLIRMIANAFDMSAMALGIEHDVNRAVGTVLDDKDFRSAIVPIAKRLEEAFTRRILHEKLGWYDLHFKFLRLEDPDIQTLAEICSRMYSANAMTPNQYRTKMGEKPLDTPFADLTQFEAMMLNMEAMQKVQEQVQTRMMQKQAGMQQQMMDQQQPPDSGWPDDEQFSPTDQGPPPAKGSGGYPATTSEAAPLRMTPGNVSRGGQPPNPRALSLPKFPISGSRYNARQIAQMPVNKVSDLIIGGQLPGPGELLDQMQEQEPGILDQMTEELRQFFEDAVEYDQQQKAEERQVPAKLLKDWQQKQVKRVREQANRINNFAEWLYKRGQFQGRPGGGSSRGGLAEPYRARGNRRQSLRPVGGKPGDLNVNPVTFSGDDGKE